MLQIGNQNDLIESMKRNFDAEIKAKEKYDAGDDEGKARDGPAMSQRIPSAPFAAKLRHITNRNNRAT